MNREAGISRGELFRTEQVRHRLRCAAQGTASNILRQTVTEKNRKAECVCAETVGETDREMRGQRAGSEEGMREAADDSEETGRKDEGTGM